MFKFLKIFSMEKRLTSEMRTALEGASKHVVGMLNAFNKRLATYTRHFDKAQSEMRGRLSRIEVLFEEELAAKESKRDALVKDKRLKRK